MFVTNARLRWKVGGLCNAAANKANVPPSCSSSTSMQDASVLMSKHKSIHSLTPKDSLSVLRSPSVFSRSWTATKPRLVRSDPAVLRIISSHRTLLHTFPTYADDTHSPPSLVFLFIISNTPVSVLHSGFMDICSITIHFLHEDYPRRSLHICPVTLHPICARPLWPFLSYVSTQSTPNPIHNYTN
jgi:hypothetical protein